MKDVEFGRNLIVVHEGKGAKDRRVPLPMVVRQDLVSRLARVKRIHEQDLSDGFGSVYLPDALARKYPMASIEWAWQWLFPAADRSTDPRTGSIRRHHLQDWNIQRPVEQAVRDSGSRNS